MARVIPATIGLSNQNNNGKSRPWGQNIGCTSVSTIQMVNAVFLAPRLPLRSPATAIGSATATNTGKSNR